tara:strand:+ start:4398 stop:6656 length:2259 start_codon:yes stop_codon:yes gene_type:complete
MAVSKDIRIRILAEAKEFAKGMREVPKTTERQVGIATRAFIKEMTKAEAASAKAAQRAAAKQAAAHKKAAKASAESWKKFGAGIAAAGAAVAAAGAAVARMGQHVADLRNDLIDASTRTGIAAATLGGLRLAAEGSGQAFDSLLPALDKLPSRMADVAKGTGPTAEAFQRLGVEAQIDGKLRPADDVLRDLLASLSDVEDPTTRAALATQAFGKSGGKLLQALGDTSSLEAFVRLSDEFGVGVGEEAAQASGDWQRAVTELGLVFDGLQARLVGSDGIINAIEQFTVATVFVAEVGGAAIVAYGAQLEKLATAWRGLLSGDLPQDASDLFVFKTPIEAVSAAIETARGSAADSAETFRELRDTTRDAAAGMAEAAEAQRKIDADFRAKPKDTTEADAAKAAQRRAKAAAAERSATAARQRQDDAARIALLREEADLVSASATLEGIQADNLARRVAETGQLVDQERAINLEIEARLAGVAAELDRAVAQGLDQGEAALALEEAITVAELERVRRVSEARGQAHATRMMEIQSQFEATQRMAAGWMSAIDTLATFEVNRRSDALRSIQDRYTRQQDDLSASEKRALRRRYAEEARAMQRAFVAMKTARISEVAMSTAVAVIQALAVLGPVAGPIAAAGIAAAGAAQAAVIAAQKAPTYHTGGIVGPPADGLQPGERSIVAQDGEGVLTRSGVDAAGGPAGVAALNAGAAPSSAPTVVQFRLRHSVLDQVMVERDQRAGARNLRRNPYRPGTLR